MNEIRTSENNPIVDTSLQSWRIFGLLIAGVVIWVIVGALVRVVLLLFDFMGFEKTLLGTITREGLATFVGALAATSAFKSYLNHRSFELCSYIFAILLGSVIFGALLFFSILPGIPFSFTEGVWYAAAGFGSVAGVWYVLHDN